MNNDNFFNKPAESMDPQAQNNNEAQSFTFGEKQYSQEEVEKLVSLGQVAEEMESKWNRKIDDLYPEFTRRSQTLVEIEEQNKLLQEQLDAISTSTAQNKLANNEDLSPEERTRLIREEAKKAGLVTQDDFDDYYMQRREREVQEDIARSLVDKAEDFLDSQAKDGKPKATIDQLIGYMQENGIGYDGSRPTYETAYKLMYEKELDDIKSRQLSSLRPSGMYTTESSTAGGKIPEQRAINSSNLSAVLHEVIERTG